MKNTTPAFTVSSPAFAPGANIPKKYTGWGEDLSPELRLENLPSDAVSLAIIMDDLDHPLSGYNHWVIWNIAPQAVIAENIPHGPKVEGLEGALQGVGYGKHRYRGPKPPVFLRGAHRYVFYVYALDCMLDLGSTARKKDLLKAMQGHVLQQASIMGIYQNGQKI